MDRGLLFQFLFIVALLSAGCIDQGSTTEGPVNESIEPPAVNASTTIPVSTLPEETIDETLVEAPGEMNESPGVEAKATTTSTTLPATDLQLNELCETDTACESGCCGSTLEGRRKRCLQTSFCELRDMGEEDCYLAGLYWCGERCANESCGECEKYIRCVYPGDDGSGNPVVQIAEPVEGRPGSCNYSITYDAGGKGGYCDRNEGKLIYAVCGRSAAGEDCVKAYGMETIYQIAQKRSFHSSEGERFDLWCFECGETV